MRGVTCCVRMLCYYPAQIPFKNGKRAESATQKRSSGLLERGAVRFAVFGRRGGYIRHRLFLWRDASQPESGAVPSRSLARAEAGRRSANHALSPSLFDRNDAVAALRRVARQVAATVGV